MAKVSQLLQHGHEQTTQVKDHLHEAAMAAMTHQQGLEAHAAMPQPAEGE